MPEKLKVVLCWHMHQPSYYENHSGQYQLPWTYLHGIKDYVDMAAHLEAVPQARAVVNFAPTLLEQLDDYVKQIQAFFQTQQPLRDPLLAALINQPVHATYPLPPITTLNTTHSSAPEEANSPLIAKRLAIIEQCLRANQERLIQRFQPYKELANLAIYLKQYPKIINYLDEQYLIDLLMWYHLAWLGETVRRSDSRVKTLINKARGFSLEDRRLLLQIIGELLTSIIPRYRVLAERRQIELSFTPYAHPIMPLLIDLFSAREALPEIHLPNSRCYPDGKERVRWHVREGINVFERYFGFKPQGCWPSEGSISEPVVRLMEEFNLHWVASGTGVWNNSVKKSELKAPTLHRPYQLPKSSVTCFFRDDNLSDLIGFEFAKWHADDAVAHLTHHLENIAREAIHTGATVIALILDGENAWENYPENGYYFLSALYQRLSHHPKLELTTFSRCLQTGIAELPTVVAGSWVYGTFSTWIGDKDKNRGWEMLIEAKQAFDHIAPCLEPEQRQAAERQLAICEGSDWCWWFGGYNPAAVVNDFDSLYRMHLIYLYQLLGTTPPDYLSHAFTFGTGDSAAPGGVMRRGQENT
jgi:alpha-amylase/alpha-mannosidase (GH57 family)